VSDAPKRAVTEAPKKAGRLVVEIVAAVLIGAGVPLFWVWVGSMISDSRGATTVEASTAIVIAVGIIVTYIVVVLIAAAIQGRTQPQEPGPRHSRHPWLRSMRDEPYRPGTEKLSPVEAVFVGTAIIASIAMMIWFFAFAGSPLPA
jgi:amino acid transporter